MKFTKLIMLASVVSLACACEKEMPAVYCTPKVGHFWGVFYEI